MGLGSNVPVRLYRLQRVRGLDHLGWVVVWEQWEVRRLRDHMSLRLCLMIWLLGCVKRLSRSILPVLVSRHILLVVHLVVLRPKRL